MRGTYNVLNIQNKIVEYDEDAFRLSTQKLLSHVNNKNAFRKDQFNISTGVRISENFQGQNRRRSYYKNCIFENCNLQEAGFTGSIFQNIEYQNCNFNFSNLQSCDFRKCNFNDDSNEFILGTAFHKSIFFNCTFSNIRLEGVHFEDAVIQKSVLEYCRLKSCGLENLILKDTVLNHVRFKSMNLEYVKFDNIILDTVTLPLPSVSYIFGGIEYLTSTKDKVRITSALNKNKKMSRDEFLNLLPDLIVFYTNTHNFFPLSNIYIGIHQYDKAYTCIVSGINMSIYMKNYRMIKYFCVLLKTPFVADAHEKSQLYKYILEKISKQQMHIDEYINFYKYLPEIKNILLHSEDDLTLTWNIQTNISTTETKKLAVLIDIIEIYSKLFDTDASNNIELRHNSPYDLIIEIISNPASLISLIGIGYTIFMGINKMIDVAIENIDKALSLKHKINIQALETEDIKLNVELKKNELKLKQLEAVELHRELINNDIVINSVNHNLSNIDMQDIDNAIINHSENLNIV